MRLIGVTGGVGMGKSTTASLIEARGVPVADTDRIARDVVEPGQPALMEIQRAFGRDVVDDDGRLRRDALARMVFGDEGERKRLESILHPRIRERWESQAASWRQQKVPCGAVVIPLLYETGAALLFDVIVCVACTANTQHERLRQRGWTDEQIGQRIRAQWPVEKKIIPADYIIWTEPEVAVHRAQLDRILAATGLQTPSNR